MLSTARPLHPISKIIEDFMRGKKVQKKTMEKSILTQKTYMPSVVSSRPPFDLVSNVNILFSAIMSALLRLLSVSDLHLYNTYELRIRLFTLSIVLMVLVTIGGVVEGGQDAVANIPSQHSVASVAVPISNDSEKNCGKLHNVPKQCAHTFLCLCLCTICVAAP